MTSVVHAYWMDITTIALNSDKYCLLALLSLLLLPLRATVNSQAANVDHIHIHILIHTLARIPVYTHAYLLLLSSHRINAKPIPHTSHSHAGFLLPSIPLNINNYRPPHTRDGE